MPGIGTAIHRALTIECPTWPHGPHPLSGPSCARPRAHAPDVGSRGPRDGVPDGVDPHPTHPDGDHDGSGDGSDQNPTGPAPHPSDDPDGDGIPTTQDHADPRGADADKDNKPMVKIRTLRTRTMTTTRCGTVAIPTRTAAMPTPTGIRTPPTRHRWITGPSRQPEETTNLLLAFPSGEASASKEDG